MNMFEEKGTNLVTYIAMVDGGDEEDFGRSEWVVWREGEADQPNPAIIRGTLRALYKRLEEG